MFYKSASRCSISHIADAAPLLLMPPARDYAAAKDTMSPPMIRCYADDDDAAAELKR